MVFVFDNMATNIFFFFYNFHPPTTSSGINP